MKTINEISDKEIMKAMQEAFDFVNGVTEAKKKARARRAKADFFNLKEIVKNTEAIMF